MSIDAIWNIIGIHFITDILTYVPAVMQKKICLEQKACLNFWPKLAEGLIFLQIPYVKTVYETNPVIMGRVVNIICE